MQFRQVLISLWHGLRADVLRIKLGAFLMWFVYPAIVWMLVGLLVVVCLASCATTQREFHQHTLHTQDADTLSRQAQEDRHHQEQREDIDSIVTASVWAAMQEFARQEQERETTREHTETTQHADGSVTTTTDRTTDRAVSRQERQRQEERMQRMEASVHREISRLDSLWQQRFSEYQASQSQRDTTATDATKMTKAADSPVSWWTKLWQTVKGIFIGIIIGILIVVWRNVATDFKRIVKGGLKRFYDP